MTKRESIIISAYTGYMLTKDFADVQQFCEELLGRPVFTHELANDEFYKEIREKCKPLLIEIVQNIEEETT